MLNDLFLKHNDNNMSILQFQVLSAYSIVLIRQLKIPLHNEDHKIFDLHEELDPMEEWFLDLSPKIENILSRMEINYPVVDCFRNQT